MAAAKKNAKQDLALQKDKDLVQQLATLRETVRENRFGLQGSKDTKSTRDAKRMIARILTEMNRRRQAPVSADAE